MKILAVAILLVGGPLNIPGVTKEDVPQPFRYSGEFWDEGTELQYLRARWYDPSMGRFINEDTYEGDITNPLSLNLYTYVANNPLKYIDPTGHMMEIDNNIAPRYNQGDWDDLVKYSQQFIDAKTNAEKQAAHDAANKVRLKYANSVTRIDFVNGGSSILMKPVSSGTNGSSLQPYIKLEASGGVILGGSAEAKMQEGKLTVSFKSKVGNIGASLSATGGIELAKGAQSGNAAVMGARVGTIGIVDVGGRINTTGSPGYSANVGIGVGIGAEVKMPANLLLSSSQLEGDIWVYEITYTHGGTGPAAPTAQQWINMLNGNGW